MLLLRTLKAMGELKDKEFLAMLEHLASSEKPAKKGIDMKEKTPLSSKTSTPLKSIQEKIFYAMQKEMLSGKNVPKKQKKEEKQREPLPSIEEQDKILYRQFLALKGYPKKASDP